MSPSWLTVGMKIAAFACVVSLLLTGCGGSGNEASPAGVATQDNGACAFTVEELNGATGVDFVEETTDQCSLSSGSVEVAALPFTITTSATDMDSIDTELYRRLTSSADPCALVDARYQNLSASTDMDLGDGFIACSHEEILDADGAVIGKPSVRMWKGGTSEGDFVHYFFIIGEPGFGDDLPAVVRSVAQLLNR